MQHRLLPFVRALPLLVLPPLLTACATPNLGIDPRVAMLQGHFMGSAKADALDAADEVEELLFKFHNEDAKRRWADLYAKYAFIINAFKENRQNIPPEETWELMMAFESDRAKVEQEIAIQRNGIMAKVNKLKANAADWDAINRAIARQHEVERTLEAENTQRYQEVMVELAAAAAEAQQARQEGAQEAEEALEPEAPMEEPHESGNGLPDVSNSPASQPSPPAQAKMFWRSQSRKR